MVGVTLGLIACGSKATPGANTDEAGSYDTSDESPAATSATAAASQDLATAPESGPISGETSAPTSTTPALPEDTTGAVGTGGGSDTSDRDVANTLDGKQNQHAQSGECDDEGCECEAGFGWYPQVDASRCLQLCDTTDVLPLETDADVAALAAQGCEVIEGGLTASGSALTSFTGLEAIRYVGGDLVIQNTSAQTLAGLSGITHYASTLVLMNNTELTELGWYQLEQAGEGGVVVLTNPKLTSLSGLSGAHFSKVSFTIADNAALVSLDGLENVSQAASIAIAQNPSLLDTNALGLLLSVERLTITQNARLTQATVGALNDVGMFTISDNPLLVSVFARCLVAAETVTIENNPELTELVMPPLAAAFAIASNPKLPQCKVASVSADGSCDSCAGNDEAATCE